MKRLLIFMAGIVLIVVLFIFTQAKEDTSLSFIFSGEEIIADRESFGNHEDAILFPAIVRSSGKKPVSTEYRGVELMDIFNSLGLDISSVEKITFNASDGYRIVLDRSEIDEAKNVYLAFERDGQYMKSKRQGGNGPYQLIIRRDPFSQRWIKHVNEIVLE